MSRKHSCPGFSLMELLLVVAIMGIIAGIAIPAYVGQRRRARVIGDAQANAQVLRMQLETYKADSGVYGTSGATYTWTAASGLTAGGSAASQLNFLPQGNSRMNYQLQIGSQGVVYTLTVFDPSIGASVMAYQTNQNGSVLYRMN